MVKKFISEEWNLTCHGHENFEFVDVNLNDDNLLFIDPCLLEKCNSSWAKNTMKTMTTFFDEFFKAYYENNKNSKDNLLCHSREQNATHLGYGEGHPGKGNTLQGLLVYFKPLELLVKEISTIGIAQDLPVLIPGFAEDGLSDLITNVIHKDLYHFTAEQMRKYNIPSNGLHKFHFWNSTLLKWELVEQPSYLYEEKEMLLVPKAIVRKKYLFGTGQYFQRIILDRLREEKDSRMYNDDKPIPKKEVSKFLRTDAKHWKYDRAIDYSKSHNDALSEYHNKLPLFYSQHGKPMSDEELDNVIYYNNSTIA